APEWLQDHVPSAFLTTLPTDAVRVTASAPGSDHVPVIEAVPPSATVAEAALAATDGATLLTSSVKLAEVLAPSLSVAVMATVRLSSGPSAGTSNHDQVPSASLTRVPTEAVRVTSSAPGSDQVPLIEARLPSDTVTEAALGL